MNAADFARTINASVLTRTGSGNIPVPIFSDVDIQRYEKTAPIGRMLFIVPHPFKIMSFPSVAEQII